MEAVSKLDAGLETVPAPSPGVLVVIPAFNEAGGLPDVLAQVHSALPRADVLVIDDGSSDDTAAQAHRNGAFVARHPFNLGYGAALQTGYKFALERGYDFVVQMDADGQHDPHGLESILKPVQSGSADIVIGSRYLEKGGYRSSLKRRVGSWLLGHIASLFTRKRITDPTSGYWALNRTALALCTGSSFPHDYPDADVLIGMTKAGISIQEVPVKMYPSEGGASMHEGWRPFYYVFKMTLAIFVALLREKPRPTSQ